MQIKCGSLKSGKICFGTLIEMDKKDASAGNSKVEPELEQVTLQPGDYVDVRDTTADQRNTLADALVSAGARKGASYPCRENHWCRIVWLDKDANENNGFISLCYETEKSCKRLLTIDQVLNATNAKKVDEPATFSSDSKPEVKIIATEGKALYEKVMFLNSLQSHLSYNESYFGEDEGELKSTIHSLAGMLRNANDPKQWSGPEDGLPPVGVECEYYAKEAGWLTCEIIAHKNGHVIAWDDDKNFPGIVDLNSLRPLRTPEEKAVEELADDIANSFVDPDPEKYDSSLAEWLYKIGYRKQEQP